MYLPQTHPERTPLPTNSPRMYTHIREVAPWLIPPARVVYQGGVGGAGGHGRCGQIHVYRVVHEHHNLGVNLSIYGECGLLG